MALISRCPAKAQMLAVKMSEKYSFLVPEIMAADDDKVARFLDSDKIKAIQASSL